jgi:hypothetical protein
MDVANPILSQLADAGVVLRLNARGGLAAVPHEQVTPDLAALIRNNHAALL